MATWHMKSLCRIRNMQMRVNSGISIWHIVSAWIQQQFCDIFYTLYRIISWQARLLLTGLHQTLNDEMCIHDSMFTSCLEYMRGWDSVWASLLQLDSDSNITITTWYTVAMALTDVLKYPLVCQFLYRLADI